MSWLTRFEIPIDLPNGRQALTLKDAADFLWALPEVKSERAQKESVMEALMLCSKGVHTELARVAFLKALNQSVVVELDNVEGASESCKVPLIIIVAFSYRRACPRYKLAHGAGKAK